MSSPSAPLAVFPNMGIYEPFQQASNWGNKCQGDYSTGSSTIVQVDIRSENKPTYDSPQLSQPSSNDHDENRNNDRAKRRLAQNREAARKSRLRKKAYVQQLEESRVKLAQLEQELQRAKQQGYYVGSALDSCYLGSAGAVNTGIAAFEMEYTHWIEEQHRHVCELRNALQAHISDVQLCMLVESCLNHYSNLFRIKSDAAKADVFYLMSGMWRTSTERFFQWIGGFRPSELLNVIMPYLEPLSDQQRLEVQNLSQSSQQAEDALSQGIEKLQQTLANSLVFKTVDTGNFATHMAVAVENLQALEGFVNQADHLRQQTLQQMAKILTTRQAARGLLALGEYFHRLRALSSLWAARPREAS